MKALCYQGPGDIRYQSAPDPVLQDERDVIVRVHACSICGSDLHIFHGLGFSRDQGYCVGHEAVGEVVEVGRAVRQLRTGDRVMLSGAAGCGACPACVTGDVSRCRTQPLQVYGLGHALQGCQAEGVRVPVADFNAARIPDGVDLDQALMLTDALPTAWFGCVNADIGPGRRVAVVGLGPIGLAAVECAFVMGAAQVFAIDPLPDRRAHARALEAVPLAPEQARHEVREATRGAMLDCVVEAVGIEATLHQALRLAAIGGTVSVIGAPRSPKFEFPIALAMERSLTFRIGVCSPARWWPTLVPLVQQGRLRAERCITHRLPLDQGAEAYRLFDQRLDGVLKTVLTP